MKKISLFLAVVFGISAAAMADNLVHNGEFERLDAKGNAIGWSASAVKNGSVKFFAAGAPDGGYAQIVLNTPEVFSIRQCLNGKVKPNTKYELSFKVRAVDFSAKNVGVLFINEGWTKNSGISNIKPTAQWQKYKAIVTTPDFKKYVAIVFHGTQAKGTIEIADIEVEELDND
jgi:hypothetical protein